MTTARLPLIITAAFLLAGVGTGPGELPSAEAAFPGANGRIAFSCPATGQLDVCTMDPDGGDVLNLTADNPGLDNWPRWSGDGRLIVFHSVRNAVRGIYLMNADGSDLRLIETIETGGGFPSLSPDGMKIAYEEVTEGGIGTFVINADGTGKTLITPEQDFVAAYPSWSPDGTMIAFHGTDSRTKDHTSGLFTINANGSGLQQLTTASDGFYPDWSPDGSKIVHNGGENNVNVVRVTPSSGGGSTTLAMNATVASWSPDGAHIVYQEGGGLSVMNADGSGRVPLANEGRDPHWGTLQTIVAGVEFTQGAQELQTIGGLQESTSGSNARYGGAAFPGENGKIAFVGPTGNIATIDPAGGLPTQLGPGSQPRWSPDGSKIAFSSTTPARASTRAEGAGGGPSDIFMMNSDGSGLTNLTHDGESRGWISWSPDGSEIAMARVPGGIDILDATGTGASRSIAIPGGVQMASYPISWSPDGQRILFTGVTLATGYHLYTIRPDGAGLAQLTSGDASHLSGDWSPDGSEIVYWAAGGIQVSDASGANAHSVLNQPFAVFPVWSPDGTKIAFGLVDSGQTIHVMNRDGTNMELIAQGSVPDWQPLGGSLVHSMEFTQGVQELQAISALGTDLEGDGMPPVPIVAGRPAAMRIYMSEVEETRVYEVEATGIVNGTRFVQLEPGCTPAQRRAHEGVCRSVDFMFTPPMGDWDVTVKVRRQQDSNVLEEHTFNLTSAEIAPLIIEPVTVCDDIVNQSTGVWGCGSLFNFVQNLEFLRATFPGEVLVAGSGSTVFADTDEIPAEGDWWDVIGGNVRSLWAADGGFDNLHYFGVVRPEADAGTPGGIAYTLANAAAGKTSLMRDKMDGGLPEDIGDELVAHLLGLNMGLINAPSTTGCYGTPSATDPNWPSGSPLIDEVGYDVANEEPIPDTNADWMSLCTPRWISPYTANNLIDTFGAGAPRTLSGEGTVVGDFWLVGGTIDEEAGETEFDPLFELETEGPTGQGDGLYTIEVRDGSDAVLATRFFKVDRTIREDTGDQPVQDPDIVRFAELVPVQAGAAKIVVFAGSNEVGEIEFGGATPVVTLTSGFSRAGAPPLPVFSWGIEDGDSAAHTYWVEFSNDGGATWRTIAPNYAGTSLTIDNAITGGGDDLLIRVRASDGANTGTAVSETFNMQPEPPTGAITSPTSGASIAEGNLAWLQAMIVDPEDGFLDGDAIEWTSSRDGALGAGASLHVYDLSIGTHTISMLATDSDGFEVADSISVTVTSGAVFEGEPLALSGDVNCNGSVDSVDGLGVSRHVAGLNVSQTQPCPQLGTGAPFGHGDVNCSGEVDAIDALFILRFVAGLPVNLPGGCREIGT